MRKKSAMRCARVLLQEERRRQKQCSWHRIREPAVKKKKKKHHVGYLQDMMVGVATTRLPAEGQAC